MFWRAVEAADEMATSPDPRSGCRRTASSGRWWEKQEESPPKQAPFGDESVHASTSSNLPGAAASRLSRRPAAIPDYGKLLQTLATESAPPYGKLSYDFFASVLLSGRARSLAAGLGDGPASPCRTCPWCIFIRAPLDLPSQQVVARPSCDRRSVTQISAPFGSGCEIRAPHAAQPKRVDCGDPTRTLATGVKSRNHSETRSPLKRAGWRWLADHARGCCCCCYCPSRATRPRLPSMGNRLAG